MAEVGVVTVVVDYFGIVSYLTDLMNMVIFSLSLLKKLVDKKYCTLITK